LVQAVDAKKIAKVLEITHSESKGDRAESN